MGGVFPFLAFLCVVPQKYTNDYLRGDCISYREGFRLGWILFLSLLNLGITLKRTLKKKERRRSLHIFITRKKEQRCNERVIRGRHNNNSSDVVVAFCTIEENYMNNFGSRSELKEHQPLYPTIHKPPVMN